jgi:hypothetical protein
VSGCYGRYVTRSAYNPDRYSVILAGMIFMSSRHTDLSHDITHRDLTVA